MIDWDKEDKYLKYLFWKSFVITGITMSIFLYIVWQFT
jgi:hypothetical protein